LIFFQHANEPLEEIRARVRHSTEERKSSRLDPFGAKIAAGKLITISYYLSFGSFIPHRRLQFKLHNFLLAIAAP